MAKVLLWICLIAATLSASAMAQPDTAPQLWRCSAPTETVPVAFRHPQYEDVLALARTLSGHHITVRCVARSTMESEFGYDFAAVLFRTSEGDFEQLFFPTRQEVAELQIREAQENGRHIYQIFRPLPTPSTVSIDSSRPEYFIKDENQLIVVWGDQRMAEILRAILLATQPQ